MQKSDQLIKLVLVHERHPPAIFESPGRPVWKKLIYFLDLLFGVGMRPLGRQRYRQSRVGAIVTGHEFNGHAGGLFGLLLLIQQQVTLGIKTVHKTGVGIFRRQDQAKIELRNTRLWQAGI